MSQDPTIDSAFFQNKAMRGHLLGKAAVVRQDGLARGKQLQGKRGIDALEERGREACIDEELQARHMQPVGIQLAAGDLSDRLLCDLGGQDEDRLGQRDLLATFIVNRSPGSRRS